MIPGFVLYSPHSTVTVQLQLQFWSPFLVNTWVFVLCDALGIVHCTVWCTPPMLYHNYQSRLWPDLCTCEIVLITQTVLCPAWVKIWLKNEEGQWWGMMSSWLLLGTAAHFSFTGSVRIKASRNYWEHKIVTFLLFVRWEHEWVY